MLSLYQEEATSIEIPFVTGTLYNNETRAMSVITSEMIERMNSLTIADAIKGLVPGVNVQTDSTGESFVTMRGNKSLNLSRNALIIVDGMETTFDHANGMSVYDVESIEINKDGFGYGIKGANGVITIKTKKGG
jgi:outer membrane receptor protein involved in Fe transport